MVWINYECHNQSAAEGTFGGARCMCEKCKEERYKKEIENLHIKIESELNNSIVSLMLDASKFLTKKNDFTISTSDLEFYAWPQTFGSTNPFGAGGNSMTTHTIFCFRNTFHNDCVLNLLGRWQYKDKFEPFIRYKV